MVRVELANAYDEQDALVGARLQQGEAVIGAKVAMTTRARLQHYGLDGPIFGLLTDAMLLPIDEPLLVDEFVNPRAEPELVFVIGDELRGPHVTATDVLAATRAVHAGIEIADATLDMRTATVSQIVAHNSAAARFIVGRRGIDPRAHDLTTLGCLVEINGDVVDTAAGAALLGHPAEGVAALANHLARRGRALEPGWIVLAGSLCDAVPVTAGMHLTATYAHLGSVTLRAV